MSTGAAAQDLVKGKGQETEVVVQDQEIEGLECVLCYMQTKTEPSVV